MAQPIDLTQDSDGEDEDLKLAIAMSLAQQEPAPNTSPVNSSHKHETFPELPVKLTSGGGIAGLDRKQMEQERLARLKRKRGDEAISPPPLSRRRGSPHLPATKPPPAVSVATQEISIRGFASQSTSAPSNKQQAPPPQPTSVKLEYPNGTVKRTYVSSHPATDRDISFGELIDAPNLQSALLSSYIWDFDWLFPHFDLPRTKFVLVVHARDAYHRSQLAADFAGIPSVRLCFPSTEGIVNCMHSKLMLLFYAGRCRVVVPTANLMGFDWGAMGGVMENMVWVMDLPRKAGEEAEGEQESPFYTGLVQFLRAQGVPAEVVRKLGGFDFGATERTGTRFMHTIGGEHRDEDVWRTTGHCGLGRTVAELGLSPAAGQEIEIDFVTSSVGSLTDEFMRGMYLAAMGDDGMMELGVRQGKISGKTKGNIKSFFGSQGSPQKSDLGRGSDPSDGESTPLVSTEQADAWRTNFRFLFPSHRTVATSIGGTNSAGTICFQRRWWENAAKFPRASMRDCVSVRRGVLMHNKLMFVRYKDSKRREPPVGEDHVVKKHEHAGWVYVGSANLSESAWGRLVLDRTKKKGADGLTSVKLNCRNWECGVILPAPRSAKHGLEVFDGVVPIPVVYPGKPYEDGDMEPWFFGKEGMAA